ncbi:MULTISPECIES: hypothetical protein [Bhargavaea]|uniref:Uncharacterized protein n=2 Tax=Bhargavaea TaxID=941338 RepID=A0ABX9ZBH8_9BACL|nr:hypothetical protein [Bhargavaea beijingensis]RSK30073.1 hypothetical protein EJA12_10205 [Bhargavaea beijingensis]
MTINRKVATGLLSLGLFSIGTGIATAATYYDYDARVPAIADFETTNKTKQTTGSAYNNVTYLAKGASLVSWVENTSGTNITSKVTYSSTGKKTMDYKAASTYKGKSVHLNISTPFGENEAVSTKGNWTPN